MFTLCQAHRDALLPPAGARLFRPAFPALYTMDVDTGTVEANPTQTRGCRVLGPRLPRNAAELPSPPVKPESLSFRWE